MVATLNQPQYQPWPHAEQVVALYAGINGYLDEIPTPQVPRFQEELRQSLRTEGTIYKAIDESDDLDDETTEKLDADLERFKKPFNVEEDAALSWGNPTATGGASPMASVQDIKRRIRSVRNTRKITRAMELVAAAKLRRAQARIEAMRPYADTMRELIAGVGRAASSVRGLPLLQQREEVSTVAIVPLTGDRGLAGAFNAQVLRARSRSSGSSAARARRCAGWRSARRAARRSRSAATSWPASTPASPTSPPTATRRRSRTAWPSSSRRARSTASCSSTTRSSRR